EDATPVRGDADPEARCVHCVPSVEVRMVPVLPVPPTATNCLPVQATARGDAFPSEASVVHAAPSGEPRSRSPPAFVPTAMNCVPDQATRVRTPPGKACRVHATPSAEVRIAALPVATNVAPDETTALMLSGKPGSFEVQLIPSGDE